MVPVRRPSCSRRCRTPAIVFLVVAVLLCLILLLLEQDRKVSYILANQHSSSTVRTGSPYQYQDGLRDSQRITKEVGRDFWDRESLEGEEEVYIWDPDSLDDVFWARPGPDWCGSSTRSPLVLILVTSRPQNFERRDTIRNTWSGTNQSASNVLKDRICEGSLCQGQYGRNRLWKTVFLVGQVDKDANNMAQLLETEAHKHGDLLVGSYQDSYRNLSLKVTHGMKFALECGVQFALKTDDDCFVNVPILLRLLLRQYDKKLVELYVGKLQRELTVIREPRSKWYVSMKDYWRRHYPSYAIGTGYVLSAATLQKFRSTVGSVRVFPVEDAFTGTILRKAGVKPTHSGRFTLLGHSWHWCNFLYLVVMHHIEAEEQEHLLRTSLKARDMCPQQKEEIVTWD